jgi:DNA repair exonuclease SbcCD ATPase subunit
MKLYDEDGNEVEAFTKEEVNTKTAELTKQVEESKQALATKAAELEKLTKLHEDKSTSYTELLKKNKEYEAAEKTRHEEIESRYSKAIEEEVKKIAGDDKEYAKALKTQLEREGIKEVTAEADKIAKQIKEAKALTDIALSREPNANPIDGGGNPPVNNGDTRNFTETAEGKATYDVLSGMMGLPPETSDKK